MSKEKHPTSTKERLTVEWLSQAITELRSELSELQEVTNNTTRSLQQRNQFVEDIAELRTDFQKFKLDLQALKLRQEATDKIVQELRSEAIQINEDFRRSRLHVSVSFQLFLLSFHDNVGRDKTSAMFKFEQSQNCCC